MNLLNSSLLLWSLGKTCKTEKNWWLTDFVAIFLFNGFWRDSILTVYFVIRVMYTYIFCALFYLKEKKAMTERLEFALKIDRSLFYHVTGENKIILASRFFLFFFLVFIWSFISANQPGQTITPNIHLICFSQILHMHALTHWSIYLHKVRGETWIANMVGITEIYYNIFST